MQDYLVRYPGAARDAKELDAALVRIRGFEDSSPALSARWLHGYAMREPDGAFGLACVFRADGPGTLGRHAEVTRLPPAEILPIVRAWVIRRFAPTMVYLVRRRAAWTNSGALERAVESARRVADQEMASRVSWLCSYAVRERDGSLGTACLYRAVDPDALRRHAERAGIPADDIAPVIGRIVHRAGAEYAAVTANAAASPASIH